MWQFYLYFLLFFMEVVEHVDGGELLVLFGTAIIRLGTMID